jgi:hypothetical protein
LSSRIWVEIETPRRHAVHLAGWIVGERKAESGRVGQRRR